jgi:hypothetical protein
MQIAAAPSIANAQHTPFKAEPSRSGSTGDSMLGLPPISTRSAPSWNGTDSEFISSGRERRGNTTLARLEFSSVPAGILAYSFDKYRHFNDPDPSESITSKPAIIGRVSIDISLSRDAKRTTCDLHHSTESLEMRLKPAEDPGSTSVESGT